MLNYGREDDRIVQRAKTDTLIHPTCHDRADQQRYRHKQVCFFGRPGEAEHVLRDRSEQEAEDLKKTNRK